MAISSFKRQFFLGTTDEFNGTTATPERKMPLQITVTPNEEFDNIGDIPDGTKAATYAREKVGDGTTVSITGRLYYEHMPWLMSMVLGGGTQLAKTVLDAAAANNPNTVAEYTSSVSVKDDTLPEHYTLFFTDGDDTVQVRGFYATNLEITAEAGTVATFTLTAAGEYPEPYTQNYNEPPEIEGSTRVVVINNNVMVGTEVLDDYVRGWSMNIASGLQAQRYANSMFGAAKLITIKREHTLSLQLTNDQDVKDLRQALKGGVTTGITIVSNGAVLRTDAPTASRDVMIDVTANMTTENALYPDESGEIGNNLDFTTVASGTGKDIEVVATVANDAGGLV